MIMSDVVGALVRRWYLLLAGLLVAVGLLRAVMPMVPVTYEAKAVIVLLPPRTLENIGGNPYLALGGLDSVVGVLSRAMTTDAAVQQVRTIDDDASYTVEPDVTTSGPVLLITSEARTPEAALEVAGAVADLAPTQLAGLQRSSEVEPTSFITTSLVTRDTAATEQRKSQLRAMIAVGVGALGGIFMGITLIDGLLLRRRESKRLRVVAQVEQTPVTSTGQSARAPRSNRHRDGNAVADDAHLRPTGTATERR